MSELTTKQQAFLDLQAAAAGCTACPLCENRTQVVFGVGNPDSPVLIVGEGPGEQEDLQGEPYLLRHLSVSGSDLIKLGIKGAHTGAILRRLLDAVIDNPALNEKETLLKMATT